MTIELTKAAAQQIQKSAQEGEMEGLALRIAAKRKPDGGIEYAMGFDEGNDADSRTESHGVSVLIAPTSADLVAGMTLDYVEIEPGQPSFIFLNPNDPHYVPPQSGEAPDPEK